VADNWRCTFIYWKLFKGQVIVKPLQDILAGADGQPEWTGSFFGELVGELEGKYLQEINYRQKLTEAAFPIDVMNAARQDLGRRMRGIEEKKALRDAYHKVHSYGTTVINDLLRKEKRIRTLFQAVEIYCLIRGRDIHQIAPLIAEYRAYYRLQKKIGRKVDRCGMGKVRMKAFGMEVRKRESKTPYIKVFCPEFGAFGELASTLSALETVRIANVGYEKIEKETLTVYPAKGCDISVTEVAVKTALEAYFTNREENQNIDAEREK
jgi:hypothetical protein